ncbi:unnamed protein product [Phytophthora fragariaefolia]|uniref:Unnamed protein product n=1 Tax=Phytophthora fragariaefolia TaxID=1490495 RepID=A0A9W6TLB4_9STRA|nr:unnamed protein product [Phytophthora fragariaefolia]
MIYDGHAFHAKRTIKNKEGKITRQYLSCVNHRSGCPCRLIVSAGAPTIVKNSHTCGEPAKPAINTVAKMKHLLEVKGQAALSVVPGKVWDNVYELLKTKYKDQPFEVLSRNKGIRHVQYIRETLNGETVNGGDFFRTIETELHCFLSEMDEGFFLLFNSTFVSKNDLHRICGCVHPEQISILKHPGLALFIDGTFKICPKPFYQVLIIVAHDASVDVYVPVAYVLATSKCESTYTNALYWLQASINFKL